LQSNQTASYNALQVSGSKRMSQHFVLNGFYVLGHAFWSASPGGETIGDIPQDFSTMQGERSVTDTDERHSASLSGIWDISYYRGSRKWMGATVNGWQISPIVSLDTGTPINLLTGSDKNADQYSTDRPDYIAGVSPKLDPHRNRVAAAAEWFNTAAFQANGVGVPGGIGPGGEDGNVPRNALYGPGYRDIDLGIFRTVDVWENVKVQFRAEASNAFNIVSLNNPIVSNPQVINPTTGVVTTPAASTFGKITSQAGSPRQIQLGARLTF